MPKSIQIKNPKLFSLICISICFVAYPHDLSFNSPSSHRKLLSPSSPTDMSYNSGQLSGEIRGRGCHGCHGFPSKCHCGLDVVIYTSTTKQNPGRLFFRCPSKRDDHLFKWVEDSVYEEVVDTKSKVIVEIEELNARIEELKEDGMWTKKEIKK